MVARASSLHGIRARLSTRRMCLVGGSHHAEELKSNLNYKVSSNLPGASQRMGDEISRQTCLGIRDIHLKHLAP